MIESFNNLSESFEATKKREISEKRAMREAARDAKVAEKARLAAEKKKWEEEALARVEARGPDAPLKEAVSDISFCIEVTLLTVRPGKNR